MVRRIVVAMVASALLAGCAGMYYDRKLSDVSAGIRNGNVKMSLDVLQSGVGASYGDSASKSPDLLYDMELGELRRLDGDIAGSTQSWRRADADVSAWEQQAKLDPSRLLGDIGAFVVNDTLRRYEGRDYEKVLLNIDLALNHLALNDWDSARIEIRKMHERQAIIADFRSKQLQQAADDAAAKNIRVTSFKELGGYPIETLEAPEVQSLKNAYESAFGNYLAGFVYEALGETSLAAPGYRKAIEMRPGVPELESALASLDARAATSKPSPADDVDVLFVVESGLAPAISSQQFPLVLPIPCKQRICPTVVPLSWPVIRPSGPPPLQGFTVDGSYQPLVMLSSVNAMARRALYDEMPAILTRTAVRAIAKVTAQRATDDAAMQAGSGLGPLGGLLSLATKVAVTVTEVADERTWRTLPDAYLVARQRLKSGQHQLAFNLAGVTRTVGVTVSGRYAVVTLRAVGNQLYLNAAKAVAGRAPDATGTPAALFN